MRDRVGETHEGTVTALVGSGVYVSLDSPFVDVLVRFEGLGPDRYESSEDEISVVGVRSGDTISLGDRLFVTIEDIAVLRRTVYARRVVPKAMLEQFEGERGRERDGGRDGRRDGGRDGGRKAPGPRREQRQLRVGERRGPGAAPAARGARPSGKSRFGQREQQQQQPSRGGSRKGRKGRR
jgi:ribonuclease R